MKLKNYREKYFLTDLLLLVAPLSLANYLQSNNIINEELVHWKN